MNMLYQNLLPRLRGVAQAHVSSKADVCTGWLDLQGQSATAGTQAWELCMGTINPGFT